MDRLAELTADLSNVLRDLHDEAAQRELGELFAPLAWLDEANGWLNYELVKLSSPGAGDSVPFVQVPIELRTSAL